MICRATSCSATAAAVAVLLAALVVAASAGGSPPLRLLLKGSTTLPGGAGAGAVANFGMFGYHFRPAVIVDQEIATGSARFTVVNITADGDFDLSKAVSYSTPAGSCPIDVSNVQYGTANTTLWVTCSPAPPKAGEAAGETFSVMSTVWQFYQPPFLMRSLNVSTADMPPLHSMVWDMLASGGTRLWGAAPAWGRFPAALWMVQAYPMTLDASAPLPPGTASIGGVAISSTTHWGGLTVGVVVAPAGGRPVLAIYDASTLAAGAIVPFAAAPSAAGPLMAGEVGWIALTAPAAGAVDAIAIPFAAPNTPAAPVSLCRGGCTWGAALSGVGSQVVGGFGLQNPAAVVAYNTTSNTVVDIAEVPGNPQLATVDPGEGFYGLQMQPVLVAGKTASGQSGVWYFALQP